MNNPEPIEKYVIPKIVVIIFAKAVIILLSFPCQVSPNLKVYNSERVMTN